jgi:hypothetical protein
VRYHSSWIENVQPNEQVISKAAKRVEKDMRKQKKKDKKSSSSVKGSWKS